MTKKYSVLFVCIHNSARSQMAEAFLRQIGGNSFTAASAGLEAGVLNPLVIGVMGEIGLDIRNQSTDTVKDIIDQKSQFDYVITVCDAANAQRCPLIPGTMHTLHWGFDDPATVSGDAQEKVAQIRVIRDQIREQVCDFVQSFGLPITP
ncbi:MAG: arsenate reductase ArsC [Candidatus Electrothrix scaldis]|nr:MAG: arsenate reductase ArsC [Candidatus Electrothrix sp. GW3-3]